MPASHVVAVHVLIAPVLTQLTDKVLGKAADDGLSHVHMWETLNSLLFPGSQLAQPWMW